MDPRAPILTVVLLALVATACHRAPREVTPGTAPALATPLPPVARAEAAAPCPRRPDPEWLARVYEEKSAAVAGADDAIFAYIEATLFGLLCTLEGERFMQLPPLTEVQSGWSGDPSGRLYGYSHVLEHGECRWRILIDRTESPELFEAWEQVIRAEQEAGS